MGKHKNLGRKNRLNPDQKAVFVTSRPTSQPTGQLTVKLHGFPVSQSWGTFDSYPVIFRSIFASPLYWKIKKAGRVSIDFCTILIYPSTHKIDHFKVKNDRFSLRNYEISPKKLKPNKNGYFCCENGQMNYWDFVTREWEGSLCRLSFTQSQKEKLQKQKSSFPYARTRTPFHIWGEDLASGKGWAWQKATLRRFRY